MAIISREVFNELSEKLYENLKSKLFEFLLPITRVGDTYDYLAFMEVISKEGEDFIRRLIVSLIQSADAEFRNSHKRRERYYVKQTRPRTIVTMFGAITFIRTEYIDRSSNEAYIYIDSKLHLDSRIRYAPDVRARIFEQYADCKSMSEVGKNIGDMIAGKYHNDDSRIYSIPRQTIQYILKNTKETRILSDSKKDIEVLNILIDEKWIPGQHNLDEQGNNKSLMTKVALIYEEYVKKDDKNKRNRLENCTYYSAYQKDFASELIELIDSKYNLESLKQINFMADGANWINEVAKQLVFPNVKVNVGLCPFHSGQALDRITRDKGIYNKAYDYLINKNVNEFKRLTKSLIEANPNNQNTIDENSKYLLKHIDEIITMNKLKVPCAMEQVISHHVAAQFTCVAKAYSPVNINHYTAIRDAYHNGHNLKLVYAKANDLSKTNDDVIKINKKQLDLSYFDNQSPLPYYPLKVNQNSQKFKFF